jgi:site-specific recombinase XerC
VEAIRAQMLLPVAGREEILALRDAVIVSLQYGLCARNQEVWGLRWRSVHQTFAEVVEVIYHGQLDEWGKTEHSAQRRTAIPGILVEDLDEWRAALRSWGHPARDVDFVIPGGPRLRAPPGPQASHRRPLPHRGPGEKMGPEVLQRGRRAGR